MELCKQLHAVKTIDYLSHYTIWMAEQCWFNGWTKPKNRPDQDQ